jgi:SpoIID/LytB domain protein
LVVLRFRLPVLLAIGLAAVGMPSAPAAPPPAVNEAYQVPPSGTFTIQGRGFGHGHGMSQWGAYGAAKVADLSSNQILHFYYPHTTLATKPVTRKVRVLLTAAGAPASGYLEFNPAPGLTLTPQDADAVELPEESAAGDPVDRWRLRKVGAGKLELRAHTADGWTVVRPDVGSYATLSDPAAVIALVEPSGSGTKTVRYRGELVAEMPSSALQVVNVVPVEAYLRSVVPAEMPHTWSAAALRAQAVAARTYTWRGIANPKASWFDLNGDTRDQAYAGLGAEAAETDAAIHDTAGEVIVDSHGRAIFAQYMSADGGWTVSGGQSYLPAKHDPYDGKLPNGSHSWSTKLSATTIASTFPSVGQVKELVVTGRDGQGAWGGRVTSLTVVGSDGTKPLTGTEFQSAFGLRSAWFRPTPPPGAPTAVAATAAAHTVTVTWKPPNRIRGAATVTGYRVRLRPGRHVVKTKPDALSASFADLKPDDYTASVVARSAAGRGASGSADISVKPL